MRWILALPIGFLISLQSASGHHAGATVYNPTRTTEIEGEVIRIFWRNPHVHFLLSVTGADGRETEWDVESNSVSILSRMGVTPDVVRVGSRVRIAGWPARRQSNGMFATHMLLSGGPEVLLNPGVASRWSGETLGTSTRLVSDGAADAREGVQRGIFRVWSTNMANPASFPLFRDVVTTEEIYPLTQSARQARDSWDAVDDNPYLGCTPVGMPRVMGQPYPIEFVDQGDEILLRIELYDIERNILLNSSTPPSEVPRSPLGHSVGHWDGGTLVVTTTRVDWPYFDQSGVPLGENAEIVERFLPHPDGSRLDYTLTVTDPATFTEPVTLRKYWTWRPGEELQRFDCVEFEEVP
jgi:hypothetical protein